MGAPANESHAFVTFASRDRHNPIATFSSALGSRPGHGKQGRFHAMENCHQTIEEE
jgi:hypothetical protein